MFLKLTVLFTFSEGKTEDETKANFLAARSKYDSSERYVTLLNIILLNVDNIHTIVPAKLKLKNDPIEGSFIKYKSSTGIFKTALVSESFEELLEKLV